MVNESHQFSTKSATLEMKKKKEKKKVNVDQFDTVFVTTLLIKTLSLTVLLSKTFLKEFEKVILLVFICNMSCMYKTLLCH